VDVTVGVVVTVDEVVRVREAGEVDEFVTVETDIGVNV